MARCRYIGRRVAFHGRARARAPAAHDVWKEQSPIPPADTQPRSRIPPRPVLPGGWAGQQEARPCQSWPLDGTGACCSHPCIDQPRPDGLERARRCRARPGTTRRARAAVCAPLALAQRAPRSGAACATCSTVRTRAASRGATGCHTCVIIRSVHRRAHASLTAGDTAPPRPIPCATRRAAPPAWR